MTKSEKNLSKDSDLKVEEKKTEKTPNPEKEESAEEKLKKTSEGNQGLYLK